MDGFISSARGSPDELQLHTVEDGLLKAWEVGVRDALWEGQHARDVHGHSHLHGAYVRRGPQSGCAACEPSGMQRGCLGA